MFAHTAQCHRQIDPRLAIFGRASGSPKKRCLGFLPAPYPDQGRAANGIHGSVIDPEPLRGVEPVERLVGPALPHSQPGQCNHDHGLATTGVTRPGRNQLERASETRSGVIEMFLHRVQPGHAVLVQSLPGRPRTGDSILRAGSLPLSDPYPGRGDIGDRLGLARVEDHTASTPATTAEIPALRRTGFDTCVAAQG